MILKIDEMTAFQITHHRESTEITEGHGIQDTCSRLRNAFHKFVEQAIEFVPIIDEKRVAVTVELF